MEKDIIYIKNMVCRRCILTVSNIFKNNGITPVNVELGTVILSAPLIKEKEAIIRHQLEEYGFEVIDNKRVRVIEQVRVGPPSRISGEDEPVRLSARQMPQGIQCTQ